MSETESKQPQLECEMRTGALLVFGMLLGFPLAQQHSVLDDQPVY